MMGFGASPKIARSAYQLWRTSWQWRFPLRTKHTSDDVSLTSILQMFSDEHPVVLLYSDSDQVWMIVRASCMPRE